MPEQDLLEQLRRYGAVLDAAAARAEATAPPANQGPVLTPRHRVSGRVVAAGAALVATAAVIATLVLVPRDHAGVVRVGGAPAAPTAPPGPMFATTGAPPGFVPSLVETTPRGASSAMTVQTFTTSTGSGASGRITLVIEPTTTTAAGTDAGAVTIQGHPGNKDHTATATMWSWLPPHASIVAVAQGFDDAAALRILDGLRPRAGDPIAGFDPPAGSEVTLAAQHVSERGAPGPAASAVYYALAGAADPKLVVRAVAPASDGSTNPLLITAGGGVSLREIGGAERIVTPATNGWVDVSWLTPDGTLLTVAATGLSDAQLAAAVRGVVQVDARHWVTIDQMADQHAGAIAKGAKAERHSLANGTVTLHLTSRSSAGAIDVACLQPTSAASPTCVPLRTGNRGGGVTMVGPAGWEPVVPIDADDYTASAVIDGQWWVFGGRRGFDRVSVVDASGHTGPVDTTKSRIAGRGTGVVFAAQVPADSTTAKLTFGDGLCVSNDVTCRSTVDVTRPGTASTPTPARTTTAGS